MNGRPGGEATAPGRLRTAAQYALLAGPLLSMLDSSIVNVAAEPIARQLHAPLTSVQWAVSGYLLAMGTGLAATSYLARRFGTRPVYLASLIAFTLSSAACAAAPDVAVLIGRGSCRAWPGRHWCRWPWAWAWAAATAAGCHRWPGCCCSSGPRSAPASAAR